MSTRKRMADSHFSRLMACLLLFSLAGCTGKGSGGKEQARFEQYYVQGNMLYKTHCSNCHQNDGSGLGKLIPPLSQSDYLLNDLDRAVCIIKNGQQGPIVVNGTEYNQLMPANERLTPLEIAEIMTYISNAWGNEKGIYDFKQAEAVLSRCTE